jgi:mono/diheme cytochrome c family protein
MQMRKLATIAGVAGVALACAASTVSAQAKPQGRIDFGEREYRSSCAVCHGLSGKGDGPYQPFQAKSPSNLTLLSNANGGVFPYQRVYEIIDGRLVVAAHGPRDMPIWGARYLAESAGYYMDVPYDPEAFVRTRVAALVDYVYRIQVK